MCQEETESGSYMETKSRCTPHGVTTKAEVHIPVVAKPHLLAYMDLQIEALDKERLRNNVDAY